MNKTSPRWVASRLGAFSVATLLSLYAINMTVLRVGTDHYRHVIRNSVADGSFAQTVPLPLGHTPVYARGPVDCLVLFMLVAPRHDAPLLRGISPMAPAAPKNSTEPNAALADGYPAAPYCASLSRIMLDPEEVSLTYYHRYLHGSWSYLGLLLAFLSIKAATVLSLVISYALLAFLAVAACLKMRRCSKLGQPLERHLAFFVLALNLILFSGINVFATSLSLVPADLVVSVFLIVAYLFPLCTLRERRFVLVMIALGCLTVAFEFMTGGILAGLTAFLTALVLGGAPNRDVLLRRAVLGGLSFCAAIVLCLALKMLVVAVVWGGGELGVFKSRLTMHMGAGDAQLMSPSEIQLFQRLGLNPSIIERSRAAATVYGLVRLAYSSFTLAFGSHILGVLIIGGGWLAAVVSNGRAMRRDLPPDIRSASAILLTAALIAPVWYLVFPYHTIVHSYFMVRPLAWGPGLFLIGLIYRRKNYRSMAQIAA